MRRRKKAATVEQEQPIKPRTLLIQGVDGEFKVTLPVGSRVTFGPTIPYAKTNRNFEHTEARGYSLRVYENAKNDSLVAVFAGIQSFRDITMPHAKLVIREAGKSVWKSDEEGYKVEHEVKREHSFEELRLLEK